MTDIAPAIPTPAELTEAPAAPLPVVAELAVELVPQPETQAGESVDVEIAEVPAGAAIGSPEYQAWAWGHSYSAAWFPEETASLAERWGPDAADNMRFAAAFSNAHPELYSVVGRYDPRLPEHPALIECLAVLGRKYAVTAGDPSTITKGKTAPMSDAQRETIDEQIRATRKAIADAMAEQDHTRANKLYADEQALIARRDGSRTIVNGRRTV